MGIRRVTFWTIHSSTLFPIRIDWRLFQQLWALVRMQLEMRTALFFFFIILLVSGTLGQPQGDIGDPFSCSVLMRDSFNSVAAYPNCRNQWKKANIETRVTKAVGLRRFRTDCICADLDCEARKSGQELGRVVRSKGMSAKECDQLWG